jgi:hypothetical protein
MMLIFAFNPMNAKTTIQQYFADNLAPQSIKNYLTCGILWH